MPPPRSRLLTLVDTGLVSVGNNAVKHASQFVRGLDKQGTPVLFFLVCNALACTRDGGRVKSCYADLENLNSL